MSLTTTGSTVPVLTDTDFRRVCRMIHRRAGLVLADHKREMVYNRLTRLLRDYQGQGLSSWLDSLEADPGHPEWQNFVNAMTTNLTAFFREAYHFPVLADHARNSRGDYRVWCAAASSGEEPWSLAMTLSETLGDGPGRWHVTASDIDSDMLATARRGIYRQQALEVVNLKQRQDYFQRGTGPHEGWARVHNRLRSRVEFCQINLLDSHYPLSGTFDAIFCRNVMIYFDKPTQLAILGRLAGLLRPGGLLFVGHAENFSQLTDSWILRGQTVYQRREGRQ